MSDREPWQHRLWGDVGLRAARNAAPRVPARFRKSLVWMRPVLVSVALFSSSCGDSGSARPDVILITIDNLRADRLGAWGYRLDTTPTLDALVARGTSFTDCTAQSPRTWPSVASLLTGAQPATTALRGRPRPLPASLTLLPEVFGRAGYRTGAVVANFQVGRANGFHRGFAFFRESWEEQWHESQPPHERFPRHPGRVPFTRASDVSDQALAFFGSVPRGEPIFLWLHYADPLGPYDPPDAHRTLFSSEHPIRRLPVEAFPRHQLQRTPGGEPITDLGFYRVQYDREVRSVDDAIGQLFDGMAALGRPAPLIVVTSDHGESLGEHDEFLSHGRLPYQSAVHVPAIVVRDGVVSAGRRIERPVGVIDLAPTVLELAGLAVPAQFEGTSLAGLARGSDEGGPIYVFSESGFDSAAPQRSVREGVWKLVEVPSAKDRQAMTGAPLELYDLAKDPGELANVASAHPEVVARLFGALHARRDEESTAGERLQALGYGDPEEPPAVERPPNEPLVGVVLLVLDTLRADRLSIAGNPRQTTPAIDALARRGVLFEQAITGAPWTLPAMISLMSGRNATAAVYRGDRLQASAVETLQAAGIRTAAFTEGGFASAHFGFDRGFDEHEEFATKVRLAAAGRDAARAGAGIEDTFAAATRWLAGRPEGRFFLMVHTYEPHTPYLRELHSQELPSGGLGRVLEQRDSNRIHLGELALGQTEIAYLSALYDGGVAVTDRHVGRLLGHLRDVGLGDRVAVVLTSDHGEDLGGREARHAADHGHSLYDELLKVPLILSDPRDRLPARRVASQVRLVDVMPTVLDLLEVPPLTAGDGQSLLPLIRGEERGDRVAFGRVTRKGPPRVSVRNDGFKLIREVEREGLGRAELYDLAEDPGERSDRAGADPSRVAALQAELDVFLEELREEGALDFGLEREGMPDRLREQLRALGYIE